MAAHPAILFQLGASHHTAPLAVREKLALDAARASALATRLGQIAEVSEFAFVNTCNRVELYGVASSPAAFPALHAALGAVTGCTPAELDSAVTLRQNQAAIGHLFAVAAGLDSQILGETEILGQVKQAYDTALAQHWTGPVLNRLFQKNFPSS